MLFNTSIKLIYICLVLVCLSCRTNDRDTGSEGELNKIENEIRNITSQEISDVEEFLVKQNFTKNDLLVIINLYKSLQASAHSDYSIDRIPFKTEDEYWFGSDQDVNEVINLSIGNKSFNARISTDRWVQGKDVEFETDKIDGYCLEITKPSYSIDVTYEDLISALIKELRGYEIYKVPSIMSELTYGYVKPTIIWIKNNLNITYEEDSRTSRIWVSNAINNNRAASTIRDLVRNDW